MGRKGRSITLSLSDKDKERMEALALHYDMTWGDRANISKLIEAIARQKLKIAPNHDWSVERINLLDRVRNLLIDAGKMEDARAIAELLRSRTELTIPLRQQLEQFLERDVRSWRLQIERYISREQPFQLSYQDAADNLFQFTIHHARIVPRNDRQYLDCWCEEISNSDDLPDLAHNRTLRLDRIIDATVTPAKAIWRKYLATVEVEMLLYGGLFFNYSSKQGRDLLVERLEDRPQTLRVVRTITSSFWFMRDILPYGADCEVIRPAGLREKMGAIAQKMQQRYTTQD
ncbi:MAG: WYL domain-containing protein [Phormidesmis priestleyi]|uniref:WYL domain-containing protein n=1 Tax=Phormidesmis priestleyi TaxID=268141 RepID=A0A2W4XIP2_9CYAN|nr:MAG: WYL domain-containing protein [Phormidesmis priestleyi]